MMRHDEIRSDGQRLVHEQMARQRADGVEHALIDDAGLAQALDQAIGRVSQHRGRFGALHSRLERALDLGEIASSTDVVPVGILYQNREIPCYEDTRHSKILRTPEIVRKGLDAEFDKYTV